MVPGARWDRHIWFSSRILEAHLPIFYGLQNVLKWFKWPLEEKNETFPTISLSLGEHKRILSKAATQTYSYMRKFSPRFTSLQAYKWLSYNILLNLPMRSWAWRKKKLILYNGGRFAHIFYFLCVQLPWSRVSTLASPYVAHEIVLGCAILKSI